MSGLSTIVDGLTGKTARVDAENRLHTRSVSVPQSVNASTEGNTFFIDTGLINLTSDGISYLLHFKNNGLESWGVESWTASFGETDGTGDTQTHFAFEASEGTLFTAGTQSAAINLNFGSSSQLDADVITGEEGLTVTDGNQPAPTLIPAGTIKHLFPASPIIIAPGTSISSAFQPPTGNTSMNVSMQLVIFRLKAK